MRFAVPLAVAFVVSGALFGVILADSAPAFAPSYAKTSAPGRYRCAVCGAELFRSEDKFVSTTRWPSFRTSVAAAVRSLPDHSEGLDRTEVRCARCDAHLGHVFSDGRLAGDESPDANLRFCILSSSLAFEPAP